MSNTNGNSLYYIKSEPEMKMTQNYNNTVKQIVAPVNEVEKDSKTFEDAIKYNPSEPAFYENAGNSYMKIGDQILAQKYLKKAIDSFNTKKGKSEYLYGLSKLLSSEKREGCYYLALSHNDFKYDLAYSVYQKFCN